MKTWKIMGIALLISVIATGFFALVEYLVGPVALFISCFILVFIGGIAVLIVPALVKQRDRWRDNQDDYEWTEDDYKQNYK